MIAKMTQTGERGRTAEDEDKIRVVVEEEGEEAGVGAGEGKDRARPPLHPASPPALSLKPHQLNEATRRCFSQHQINVNED